MGSKYSALAIFHRRSAEPCSPPARAAEDAATIRRSTRSSSLPPCDPIPLEELPGSVIGARAARHLRDAGQQHFEDVLAAGAQSQLGGRHFARRDTFRSAASANCSSTRARPTRRWAFSIDDIDFSGLGSAATLVRCRSHRGTARSARHPVRRQRAGRAHLRQERGAVATPSAAARSSTPATTASIPMVRCSPVR